jgi:dihydrofolate reductase
LENTELKREIVKDELLELKQKDGRDILVGSPSMIVALGDLNLIDEYQINVLPIVLGSGLTLFKNIRERIDLNLLRTKTFGCGAVVLYYKATSK